MQTITRKGNFDAAHRIVNHAGKCANLHGHTYLFELTIAFDEVKATLNDDDNIGYPIDFADLKALALGYIDRYYDHALIYNPKDPELLKLMDGSNRWRVVPMWLKSGLYCNPSVENIALQLFVELNALFIMKECPFRMNALRLFETPNSYTDVNWDIDYHLLNDLTKRAMKLNRVEQWK